MQLNRFANRRTAVALAVVFAASTGLAACGTEAAPERTKAVAHVAPAAQAPTAAPDREHLAQSPEPAPAPSGTEVNGKMRLLLQDRP